MAAISFPDAPVIQLLKTALLTVKGVSSHGETRGVGLILWISIAIGWSALLCLSQCLRRFGTAQDPR